MKNFDNSNFFPFLEGIIPYIGWKNYGESNGIKIIVRYLGKKRIFLPFLAQKKKEMPFSP